MNMMNTFHKIEKEFLRCSTSLLFLLFWAIPAYAANPVIQYSDLVNGPKTGGQNNKGAFVTVWGNGFGALRGTSVVTIGGGQADNYPIWTDKKITFQLGANAATGNIVVQTSTGSSNAIPFAINNGRVFFVNGEGGSTGDGSYANPWTDPDLFINQIQAGDIVYIRGGNYTGKHGSQGNCGSGAIFALGSGSSGTAGNFVGFIAYPGETVNLGTASVDYTNGFCLMANDSSHANYLTLAGFHIRSGQSCLDTKGWITDVRGGGHDIRFIGNWCFADYGSANTMTGIIRISAYNEYVYGNDVSNNASSAINNNHGVYVVTGCSTCYVGWNNFHDLKLGHVVQVHTDNADSLGMVFSDVQIHDNIFNGNNGADMRGINAGGVTANGTYGSVYNNILYNVGQTFSVIVSYSGSWKIYNNTAYGCQTGNTIGCMRIAGWDDPSPAYLDIENNIFYVTDGVSLYIDTDSGSGLYSPSLSDPRFTIKNNLCYGKGNGCPTGLQNSVYGDPKFVNPGTGDFHIQIGSSAIDAGSNTSATVPTDFDMYPRLQGLAIDIGAYEYKGTIIRPAPPTSLQVK